MDLIECMKTRLQKKIKLLELLAACLKIFSQYLIVKIIVVCAILSALNVCVMNYKYTDS